MCNGGVKKDKQKRKKKKKHSCFRRLREKKNVEINEEFLKVKEQIRFKYLRKKDQIYIYKKNRFILELFIYKKKRAGMKIKNSATEFPFQNYYYFFLLKCIKNIKVFCVVYYYYYYFLLFYPHFICFVHSLNNKCNFLHLWNRKHMFIWLELLFLHILRSLCLLFPIRGCFASYSLLAANINVIRHRYRDICGV